MLSACPFQAVRGLEAATLAPHAPSRNALMPCPFTINAHSSCRSPIVAPGGHNQAPAPAFAANIVQSQSVRGSRAAVGLLASQRRTSPRRSASTASRSRHLRCVPLAAALGCSITGASGMQHTRVCKPCSSPAASAAAGHCSFGCRLPPPPPRQLIRRRQRLASAQHPSWRRGAPPPPLPGARGAQQGQGGDEGWRHGAGACLAACAHCCCRHLLRAPAAPRRSSVSSASSSLPGSLWPGARSVGSVASADCQGG